MTALLEHYHYFMIVDLEATCCDKNTVPRHQMEIIEIGAVMVDAKTLTIVDEFTTFIKPVRHTTLTPFCTELTTITQTQVDNAPLYAKAIQNFQNWFKPYENLVFCSWGDYDKKQFEQDSQFHQLPFPIGAPHVNIKIQFSESLGVTKRFGMNQALALKGLALEGTHHRGIDDAKNMARLMPFILGRA